MRRKLSRSYVVHGLVGGVLAVPVMLLTIYAAIFIAAVVDNALSKAATTFVTVIAWILIVLVPATTAALLYRLRQWLASEKTDLAGNAAYALPGATSGFVTIGFTRLLGETSLFGSSTMVVAAILAGMCVGVICLFFERTVQALNRKSLSNHA